MSQGRLYKRIFPEHSLIPMIIAIEIDEIYLLDYEIKEEAKAADVYTVAACICICMYVIVV